MNANHRELENDINEVKYINEICKQNPLIVIKTKCGNGKYHYAGTKIINDEVVLEFLLVRDKQFKDTDEIASKLGERCYLDPYAYLYTCNFIAVA